jgi:uncharacterized membrane protein YoaK (UPF0700 family)
MMLLEQPGNRERRHDLWLGGSSAVVAGFVNVCSVMAFFAFASNVTGHAAIFAEEMVKGHLHQTSVVIMWLAAFMVGAFLANLSVTLLDDRAPRLGRLIPVVGEMIMLVGIGYYGHHHYGETLTETEYLVGWLLLAMGLQNGIVSTVSSGVVKSTHLTGVTTDLGVELSMLLKAKYRRDDVLRFKFALHAIVFGSYLLGGVAGGVLYLRVGFEAFYIASATLALILGHDLVVAFARYRRGGEILAREGQRMSAERFSRF